MIPLEVLNQKNTRKNKQNNQETKSCESIFVRFCQKIISAWIYLILHHFFSYLAYIIRQNAQEF